MSDEPGTMGWLPIAASAVVVALAVAMMPLVESKPESATAEPPALVVTPEPTPGGTEATALPTPAGEACGAGAFLVRATASRIARGAVLFTTRWRNRTDDDCNIDVKPELVIRRPDGSALNLTHVTTREARIGPPLPPGDVAGGYLTWSVYCGPPPEGYLLELSLDDREGSQLVPVDTTLVPPCNRGMINLGEDGQSSSTFLTPAG